MIDKQERIKQLLEQKNKLGDERDLLAALYNIWTTRMFDYQDDPVKYKMYMNLIKSMEPHSNFLKEGIREINRELCQLEGVETIGETQYVRECNDQHNFSTPNVNR